MVKTGGVVFLLLGKLVGTLVDVTKLVGGVIIVFTNGFIVTVLVVVVDTVLLSFLAIGGVDAGGGGGGGVIGDAFEELCNSSFGSPSLDFLSDDECDCDDETFLFLRLIVGRFILIGRCDPCNR